MDSTPTPGAPWPASERDDTTAGANAAHPPVRFRAQLAAESSTRATDPHRQIEPHPQAAPAPEEVATAGDASPAAGLSDAPSCASHPPDGEGAAAAAAEPPLADAGMDSVQMEAFWERVAPDAAASSRGESTLPADAESVLETFTCALADLARAIEEAEAMAEATERDGPSAADPGLTEPGLSEPQLTEQEPVEPESASELEATSAEAVDEPFDAVVGAAGDEAEEPADIAEDPESEPEPEAEAIGFEDLADGFAALLSGDETSDDADESGTGPASDAEADAADPLAGLAAQLDDVFAEAARERDAARAGTGGDDTPASDGPMATDEQGDEPAGPLWAADASAACAAEPDPVAEQQSSADEDRQVEREPEREPEPEPEPVAEQETDVDPGPEVLAAVSPGETGPDAASFEPGAPLELTPEQVAAMLAVEEESQEEWGTTPIELDAGRAETLQIRVTELLSAQESIRQAVEDAFSVGQRPEAASQLTSTAGTLRVIADDFGFSNLAELSRLLRRVAGGLVAAPEALVGELLIRVIAIASLVEQYAGGLQVGMETSWPLDTFAERLDALLAGDPLLPDVMGWHEGDPERVLELDGVVFSVEDIPDEGDTSTPTGEARKAALARAWRRADTGAEGADGASGGRGEGSGRVVRVQASRLDEIMTSLRHLVLSKNRLRTIAERVSGESPAGEALGSVAEEIDRLTTDLQLSVMGTRLEGVGRQLEGYCRTVRDIGNINDKTVELEIRGGDVPADRFAMESIAGPIGALLRYYVTQMLETPEERRAAGKPSAGLITAHAANQGTYVEISLLHDGRPFDVAGARELAEAAGVPVGPSDEAAAAALFDARCADSPLAGLAGQFAAAGVSMSVVQRSHLGTGVRLEIPIESAVIPAMMIGVGAARYGIPLHAVVEVLRPGEEQRSLVSGREVLRVRDEVLPIVDLSEVLREPVEGGRPAFAVVVTGGEAKAALLVSRVIGQTELVVEALDGESSGSGPFSGATIRDDGGVSLILDIARLLRGERAGV